MKTVLVYWDSENQIQELDIDFQELKFNTTVCDNECKQTLWDIFELKHSSKTIYAYLWSLKDNSRTLLEAKAFGKLRGTYKIVKPQWMIKIEPTTSITPTQVDNENRQPLATALEEDSPHNWEDADDSESLLEEPENQVQTESKGATHIIIQ